MLAQLAIIVAAVLWSSPLGELFSCREQLVCARAWDDEVFLRMRYLGAMDSLTPEERSQRMALVRSIDTKPEMIVRRLVHGMGYRYRLHCGNLPGKPDLVFPARHAVIFVHGCFWHRHQGCALARLPKSRVEFWTEKLEGNRKRDARKIEALEATGWRVFIVWECELKNKEQLVERIRQFLELGR